MKDSKKYTEDFFQIYATWSSLIGTFIALFLLYLAIQFGISEERGWSFDYDSLSNLGNPEKYNHPVSLIAVAYATAALSNMPLYVNTLRHIYRTTLKVGKIGSFFMLLSGISLFVLSTVSENFNTDIEWANSEPHLLVTMTFFVNFGFASLFYFFGFVRYAPLRRFALRSFAIFLIVGGIWLWDGSGAAPWHHDAIPELITIVFYLIMLVSHIRLLNSGKLEYYLR